jgi:hypothetical protein
MPGAGLVQVSGGGDGPRVTAAAAIAVVVAGAGGDLPTSCPQAPKPVIARSTKVALRLSMVRIRGDSAVRICRRPPSLVGSAVEAARCDPARYRPWQLTAGDDP